MPDRQSGRIVEAGGGGGCKQQQVAPTMLDLRGFGGGAALRQNLDCRLFFVSWVIKVVNILDECLLLNRKT